MCHFCLFQANTSSVDIDDEPVETLASQKREERLRKFRELHLKRVSYRCPTDTENYQYVRSHVSLSVTSLLPLKLMGVI